jgi:FdrA protein
MGTNEMSKSAIQKLLEGPLKVVNVGLEGFARELNQQGVEVIQVDWAPPAGGDPKLADLLSKLGS